MGLSALINDGTSISPPVSGERPIDLVHLARMTLGARDRRLARRACRRSGRARRGKRGPARARSGDRTTRRRRGGNPRPDRRLAPAELAGRAAGLALARLLPIKAPTGLACRHGRADPAAFRKTSSAMTAKP